MKLYTKNDDLIVEFEGLEVFWALRKRLKVPFTAIISVDFREEWRYPKDGLWLRLGGSFLPRFLLAGYYRSQGQKYFTYVRGIKTDKNAWIAENVVTIETRDYFCNKIFLSVQSSDAIPKF